VWRTLVLASSLIAILVLGACGRIPAAEDLIQEQCTACHTLAPIEVAQKTGQEWGATVQRMIEKGARLNDREAQTVIDYLSRTYGVENP
jgi:hypothetical protein